VHHATKAPTGHLVAALCETVASPATTAPSLAPATTAAVLAWPAARSAAVAGRVLLLVPNEEWVETVPPSAVRPRVLVVDVAVLVPPALPGMLPTILAPAIVLRAPPT
jgi:hypothetical protein